jgi:hypothetical protein
MARTAVTRATTFTPASRITDFLGANYTTKGVAISSLHNLSDIFPSSSILQLSTLQRNTSERTGGQRKKGVDVSDEEPAFTVVMFKKQSPSVPPGLTNELLSKFFTNLFTYDSAGLKDEFKTSVTSLLDNPLYYVLAITVPLYKPDEDELHHYIIAAALYMYDNKNGTYISSFGVSDKGYHGWCTLSQEYFIDPSKSELLSPTTSFCSHDLATFLLATLQIMGTLGYKAPDATPTEPYEIICDDREIPDIKKTHHLYLQARLEIGSAYAMYVLMGFTTLVGVNGSYHCTSYKKDQCPVPHSKKRKDIGTGYKTNDNFLRLLVLKKWIYNVFPPDEGNK